MLETKGQQIGAAVGLLSGLLVAGALWVLLDPPLRLVAPVAGFGDALVTYLLFSRNFEGDDTDGLDNTA